MFNNYFEDQSIWNTLSTKELVLSSYHEKGLGSWARISSASNLHFAQGPGKIFHKYGKKAGQKMVGQIRASKVNNKENKIFR